MGTETDTWKAAAVGFPIVTLLISALFALAYLISSLLGLPSTINLPFGARAVGGACVLVGLAMMGWLFRHRNPAVVIVSTYVTLMKLFRRASLEERAARTEPLIVDGPQEFVRNPLYLGVIVMVLGWAMLSTSTFVFVATAVMLIWFGLVLIPFEERELSVLFGEEWKRYSEETPMLFPFTKTKKRTRRQS